MAEEEIPKSIKVIAVGVVTLIVLASVIAFVTFSVDSGEQAVVTRFGSVTGEATSGLNFKSPVDNVHRFDMRTQKYDSRAVAGQTADGLGVTFDVTVLYKLDGSKLTHTYSTVGTSNQEIQDKIVVSKTREVSRLATQSYSVEALYTGGVEQLGDEIQEGLNDDFEKNGLIVLDVQIRDMQYPTTVVNAIERKEEAKQELITKERELKIEELEADRKVIEARGIANAQKEIDRTLTDEYLAYLWITEGLEKGDTIYVVPSEGSGQPVLTKDIDDDE